MFLYRIGLNLKLNIHKHRCKNELLTALCIDLFYDSALLCMLLFVDI